MGERRGLAERPLRAEQRHPVHDLQSGHAARNLKPVPALLRRAVEHGT